jgi:hypothetical protein
MDFDTMTITRTSLPTIDEQLAIDRAARRERAEVIGTMIADLIVRLSRALGALRSADRRQPA